MGPRYPILLAAGLLGGCAGNVADYIGSRASIVRPQLIRYGFDLNQAQCVGQKMSEELTPLQLRRFVRSASALKRANENADRLAPRDLLHVAKSMPDPEVGTQLAAANAACNVLTEPPAIAVTESPATEPPAAAARQPAWLNLGAAGTGQQIAVDASSIEQEGVSRTAWFRLTEPGASAPSHNSYRLRIDCGARTITEKARRKPDGTGATVEEAGDGRPVPMERGTVMEIAWLALCT